MQLPRDLSRGPERLQGVQRLAGAMACGAEFEQHLGPLRGCVDTQFKRCV